MEKTLFIISLARPCPVDRLIEIASIAAGFLGAYEGSETPLERVLDVAEPPATRGVTSFEPLLLYFDSQTNVQKFLTQAKALTEGLSIQISEQIPQDWNAEWQRQFTGIDILPFWSIRPTWSERSETAGEYLILLDPSTGFGSGTHPTTQMLLQKIGEIPDLKGKSFLDFGSGSGILSIAAALRGADVVGVEIDPLAIAAAKVAAEVNHVSDRITFVSSLQSSPRQDYDYICANILRNVLLEFSSDLRSRLKVNGRMFLSGLLEGDLPDIQSAYGSQGVITSIDEWRALDV